MAPGPILRSPRPVAERDHRDRLEAHANRACPVEARAVYDYRIDFVEPARRLAQRSGRQPPHVAEAAHAVHHCDLDIARERIVLEPVVADDHVAIGLKQANGVGPARRDGHR